MSFIVISLTIMQLCVLLAVIPLEEAAHSLGNASKSSYIYACNMLMLAGLMPQMLNSSPQL